MRVCVCVMSVFVGDVCVHVCVWCECVRWVCVGVMCVQGGVCVCVCAGCGVCVCRYRDICVYMSLSLSRCVQGVRHLRCLCVLVCSR